MKKNIYIIFVFWIFSLCFYKVADAHSDSIPMIVFSEYQFEDAAGTEDREWRILLNSVIDDNSQETVFFSGKSDLPLYKIKIDVAGMVICQGPDGNTVARGKNSFLLLSSLPVPCNIFPLNSKRNVYETEYQAGDRKFLKRYFLFKEKTDINIARTNGWIKSGLTVSPELVMVIVRDSRNNIVAKQLWPLNSKWWIYEETQNRRSWLMPSK